MIRNATKAELLALRIDRKQIFDANIGILCKTAGSKLHTLRRIRKFLTLQQETLSVKIHL